MKLTGISLPHVAQVTPIFDEELDDNCSVGVSSASEGVEGVTTTIGTWVLR